MIKNSQSSENPSILYIHTRLFCLLSNQKFIFLIFCLFCTKNDKLLPLGHFSPYLSGDFSSRLTIFFIKIEFHLKRHIVAKYGSCPYNQ